MCFVYVYDIQYPSFVKLEINSVEAEFGAELGNEFRNNSAARALVECRTDAAKCSV